MQIESGAARRGRKLLDLCGALRPGTPNIAAVRRRRLPPHPRIQRSVRILKKDLHAAAVGRNSALLIAVTSCPRTTPAPPSARSASGYTGAVDLPHPDSPTRPSVSPRASETDRRPPRALPRARERDTASAESTSSDPELKAAISQRQILPPRKHERCARCRDPRAGARIRGRSRSPRGARSEAASRRFILQLRHHAGNLGTAGRPHVGARAVDSLATAAPAYKGAAAREHFRRVASSTIRPAYITNALTVSATTPRSCVIMMIDVPTSRLGSASARGSAPGSSRPAQWSARLRSKPWGCRRAPWRS